LTREEEASGVALKGLGEMIWDLLEVMVRVTENREDGAGRGVEGRADDWV